jgi:hypothetical protein
VAASPLAGRRNPHRSWLFGSRVRRDHGGSPVGSRGDPNPVEPRLNHGQRLLTRYAQEPDSLSGPDRELAAVLADIAVTGAVPESGHPWQPWDNHPMMQLAQHLFVTDFDLGPLVTLAVGLSGRNSETIKNLTVKHDVLEDKAVRVELVKRRRGPSRMFETVHWEIGTSSQQLRLPGGYYLLLEEMMRLGRSFSGTSSLWSVWNPRRGHYGAFDVAIHLKDWHMGRWKKRPAARRRWPTAADRMPAPKEDGRYSQYQSRRRPPTLIDPL